MYDVKYFRTGNVRKSVFVSVYGFLLSRCIPKWNFLKNL